MTVSGKAQAPARKSGLLHEMAELARAVIPAIALFLFLRVIFFQPYTIPSGSMEPTLPQGHYVIVSKFPYGWSRFWTPFSPPLFRDRLFEQPAHRGDIVVFAFP